MINPPQDSGLPEWLTTAECARLRAYAPDVRRDVLATLTEMRARMIRDLERAAQRRVEETMHDDDESEA